MGTTLQGEESPKWLEEAQLELQQALEKFATTLSGEMRGLSSVVKRRLAGNALRLKIALPSYIEMVRRLVDCNQPELVVVLDHEHQRHRYWARYPDGREDWATGTFPEPDRHYIGLVEKALQDMFKVWARRHRGRWEICAKCRLWPQEHQSAVRRGPKRRHKRRQDD